MTECAEMGHRLNRGGHDTPQRRPVVELVAKPTTDAITPGAHRRGERHVVAGSEPRAHRRRGRDHPRPARPEARTHPEEAVR